MPYFLYILLCSDNTYYVGSTNNMERRLRLHNSAHSGAKYTRGRRPVILMYSEEHQTYASVRKRESEVKRFRREQKEKLFNK